MTEYNAINPLSRFDAQDKSFLSNKKFSFKWTLQNFSKLLKKSKLDSILSPCQSTDLKPLPRYEWTLTLTSDQEENGLYLFLFNKSKQMITLEYTVALYDCHDSCLYEESDECSFGKHQSGNIMGDVSGLMSKLMNLNNDTLVLMVAFNIIRAITTVKIDCTMDKNYLFPEYNGRRQLCRDLKNLCNTKQHTDVTLSVDGRKLSAHKAILCARSPVFEKMFHHKMDEGECNNVVIEDIKLMTLQKLLDFLYYGTLEAEEEDVESIYDLYYAADKYEVLDLREMCSRRLFSKVAPDNATRLLVWADRHHDQKLKSELKDFIRNNFEAVANTEAWESFVANEINLAAETMKFCSKRTFLKTDVSKFI